MSKEEKENDILDEEIVYEKEKDSASDEVDDFSDNSKIQNKIEKLKEDLKKCQAEKQEYLDGWQRSQADFINFKKRAEESKKDFATYANEELIIELLPVLDSFDLAFKNKDAWEKIPAEWRMGVEFIYNQFKSVLSNNKVLEINPIGQKFDPKEHNSVELVDVEDKKDNDKILEVTLRGYKIGDKIIRHPNVRIGKLKE